MSIVDRLMEDARLLRLLLPPSAVNGSAEIYVITFADDSGRFYLGQHRLPPGADADPDYLGSGTELKNLPEERRCKLQLLRLKGSWADLIEELLVRKYRELYGERCLNRPVSAVNYFKQLG